MKRCPQCSRFGIEFNIFLDKEMCIWRDCRWINPDNIDVNKYKNKFLKFINAIKENNDS